eukprot:GEZU01025916.1.p2 GENE.GEZU01025916.1~~GEZU01025916.1.p2  ORF type:complete len:108 (-),score=20.70 GEZU01025916.1:145-468(-)
MRSTAQVPWCGMEAIVGETWEFVDEQFKEEFDDMSKAAIACGYASPLDSFDHNDNDSEALIQGGDVHQITAAAHLASIIMAQEKMLTPQTLQQHFHTSARASIGVQR